MDDGSFWILTDNGAGNKVNSPDFMLHLSRYNVDFKSGQFERLETVFCTILTAKCLSASSRKEPKNAI